MKYYLSVVVSINFVNTIFHNLCKVMFTKYSPNFSIIGNVYIHDIQVQYAKQLVCYQTNEVFVD